MIEIKKSEFKVFENKKVLVTGHTGFKGSWLCLWLSLLGSKIMGISNSQREKNSNFHLFNLKKKLIDKNFDIRNYKLLKKNLRSFKPDYIFHLAAQAIVKNSYIEPKQTWESNTIGTLNILESARTLKQRCTIIMITSDKVYKNLETNKGYKESDQLGGFDPYSASKASADIAINSYSKSFFNNGNIKIATARAGNVVGGGDWSNDRLIPDCIRYTLKKKKVVIRNPNSTRPWQHVLDILDGYLALAKKLNKNHNLSGEAFNFGPDGKNIRVAEVVRKMKKYWNNINIKVKKKSNFKEAKLLKLSVRKAKKFLNWKCKLQIDLIVKLTTNWYLEFRKNKNNIEHISIQQIKYFELLKWKKKH